MEWFINLPPWVEQGAYFGVFTTLVLCGLGLPVPEEVSFLLGGYLVDRIDGSLPLMIGLAVSGVLIGDSLLFALARRYGKRLLQIWPFSIIVSESNLERAKAFFVRHGSKTVFFAGFFAGVRAPTFFLSASMGVPFHRFIFWDSLRTFLTCPISVWFGYRFGPYAQEKLEPYKFWLISIILSIILGIIGKEIWRWRKRSSPPPQPS